SSALNPCQPPDDLKSSPAGKAGWAGEGRRETERRRQKGFPYLRSLLGPTISNEIGGCQDGDNDCDGEVRKLKINGSGGEQSSKETDPAGDQWWQCGKLNSRNMAADLEYCHLLALMHSRRSGTTLRTRASNHEIQSHLHSHRYYPVYHLGCLPLLWHCDILRRAAEAGGLLPNAMITNSDGSEENSLSLPVRVVANGCGIPCIDLRPVRSELSTAMEADLVLVPESIVEL
ncbi:unnamed protein product, partial [Linum tenue]